MTPNLNACAAVAVEKLVARPKINYFSIATLIHPVTVKYMLSLIKNIAAQLTLVLKLEHSILSTATAH